MASLRKRGRVWYYRFTDADGIKRERKGCSDRRETERMAREAESHAAKVRDGYLDPRAMAYRDHEARPIADHLAEFIATMEAAGRNPQHIAQTRTYVHRIVSLTGAVLIGGLTGSAVMRAIGTLREQGFSARSLNAHLTAAKTFSRWLQRDGRTREHTLAHLSTFNIESDRRRRRRALAPEEAARLIEAAEQGPVVRGMAGPDRAMLYRLALGTGFRRDELRSLAPESFRLDDDPPTVVCEAAYTKNGQRAEQPISEALAAMLRPWVATRPPGRPAFAMPARPAEMLRADLAAAGIPYRTPEGVADLHSLRATYITHLVNGGASVKTCQTLARHSTPTLTIGIYAKASLHDVTGAVAGLPDLTARPTGPEAGTMAATGTDGQHIRDGFAHHLPTEGDGSGRIGADADVMGATQDPPSMRRNPLDMTGFDASGRVEAETVGRVADGIRTRDLQIHNLAP